MEGLDYNSVISMADGQYLMLQELEEGDTVFSYDFKTKKIVPAKIIELKPVEKEYIYMIKAKEEIICSEGVKIMLNDGSFKPVNMVKENDIIIDDYGQEEPVVKLNKLQKPLTLIYIKPDKGNIIADGFIVKCD